MIDLDLKQKLLLLARQSIQKHFDPTTVLVEIDHPLMQQKRGVFVTLSKYEHLRGCIGLIEPIQTVKSAIIEMAPAAAFEDPRFVPLTKDELAKIRIEISILTTPQRITSAKQIRLGIDGVIIGSGFQKGVFLPQVATETGWDLEQFMNHLCGEKAGLPTDYWKRPDSRMAIFQAECFREPES